MTAVIAPPISSTWIDLDDFITSGDFQRICEGRSKRLDLNGMPEGAVVYERDIRTLQEVVKKIRYPCVFVSNFHDYSVTEKAHSLLDHEFVRHVFSVNVATEHPKLTPIPLALKDVKGMLKKAAQQNGARDILCLANFKQHNNARRELWSWCQSQPWITPVEYDIDRTRWQNYYDLLVRSRFVLSPPGNGMDCYRTWEALAAGAVPVVLQSPLESLYAGLPILRVREWADLTPELLEGFAPQVEGLRKLSITHWKAQIEAARGV